MKFEAWECWISITGGAGTAYPCVQWHLTTVCYSTSYSSVVLLYSSFSPQLTSSIRRLSDIIQTYWLYSANWPGSLMFIFSDSSLCRMRQPAWSPGLVVTTTSRRFLLAYTGFQYASESSTRWRCLCGSVYTMQPLATWLTCLCPPTPCVVASNCVPRRLGLCWSRAPGLLLVSAASPSMDHEHGTVCQPIFKHQIRLCALSSVISRPTCFSSSLRCC